MSGIPALVRNDVYDAVNSAILFGVSASDFKNLVVEAWEEELRLKIQRDLQELSK